MIKMGLEGYLRAFQGRKGRVISGRRKSMYKGTESWIYMARLRISDLLSLEVKYLKVCRDEPGKRNWGHVVCEMKEFTY